MVIILCSLSLAHRRSANVWSLLPCFRGHCWNVGRANQIVYRAISN